MGQSLVQNYIHIVFSTKNRLPLIQSPYKTKLHEYIGGTCKKLGCHVVIVGGHSDHIHILLMLSKKITLMSMVQKVKAATSKWMKTQAESLKEFTWQDGYGAFSISSNEVETICNYIKNQRQHHSRITFKEEYSDLLSKYCVNYNEKYVWD